MHEVLATPALVESQLLPEIHEGDSFTVLGHTFIVTQVINEACYVKPAGANYDRHVPKLELQKLLARLNQGARADG